LNELRLLFGRTGDTLTYRVVPSWGGDAGEAQPFVPFLGDEDYEDLRWYLEDYMDLPTGGAVVRAERIERSLGATCWNGATFNGPGSAEQRLRYRYTSRRCAIVTTRTTSTLSNTS